jgi:hypothetical protein
MGRGGREWPHKSANTSPTDREHNTIQHLIERERERERQRERGRETEVNREREYKVEEESGR